MSDFFARIGRALEALAGNSTLNGDVRAETLRLAAELQGTKDNFAEIIRDRVRAEVEALAGRTSALEEGKTKLDAVVFSTANAASLGLEVPPVTAEETERLRGLFNGADPTLFDRDGNGEPGGSKPAPVTDDPDKMTIAQCEAWLDARSIDRKDVTLRDDLRDLVRKAQEASSAPAETSAKSTG